MGVNETVLNYLKEQNRPYNANDITQNLHKQYGRTAIQKALDYLVAKGKVRVKTYGKQKVYAIKREGKFSRQEYQARQEALKTKLATLEAQNNEHKALLKKMENQLKDLKGSMTNKTAISLRNELRAENEKLQTRYEQLASNAKLMTEADKKKLLDDQASLEKEWRKRRRMALDVLDAILENYPKSKQSLYEEIGVETDEEAGVKVPSAY